VSISVPFLDLREQARRLGRTVESAVAEVLASQQFILGPHVERFEAAMAESAGARHAIGVGSGTDALLLALAALGVGPGARVVTTPFSFFATASCIARLGARPVFVDVDPDTLNLAPAAVARALAEDAGDVVGILPVHLYGRLADMAPLAALAAEHGLWVVEDAAQAIGARSELGAAGTIGRAGCLSFYPTKNLGGIADGGMVLTDEDAVAARIRVDRNQGTTGPYRHGTLGACSRLAAVNAAALAAKLPHLAAWNARRREVAATYDAAFRAAGLAASEGGPLALPPLAGDAHVWHQYVVQTPRRDALARHLAESGVATQVYYPVPLHRQPALAGRADVPARLVHAERAAEQVLALPIYAEIADAQLERVVDAVAGFYRTAAVRTL
jgi:dTDP-4-amino-4,6-dideoxygalactose transaminase